MTQLIFDIEDVQRVRGTVLSFLLLVRSAEPADRRCDRQTDRLDKGALSLLVLNTLKLSFSSLYVFNIKYQMSHAKILQLARHKKAIFITILVSFFHRSSYQDKK